MIYTFVMEQPSVKTPREIGRMIAAYFKENNISQEEAASRLGLASKQVVANQLYGKRFGRDTAAKYANVFGFNEMFLLTGKGELLPSESAGQTEKLKKENAELICLVKSQQDMLKSQQETIRQLSEQLQPASAQ